jgi:prepilin-type N-terminal cleavage/methylation domain-containing protein
MMKSKHSGFTLIETVVALTIIAILAAVLTPLVGKYVDQARVTRASQEAGTIAEAVLNFNKNTGKWPIFRNFPAGGTIDTNLFYTVLVGPPGTPPGCDFVCGATWGASGVSERGDLAAILERNAPWGYSTSGKFAWRGPYLMSIGMDPWGNAYVVNASSLAPGKTEAGFVLSAGPDGKIDTSFAQSLSSAVTVSDDDIAARIR